MATQVRKTYDSLSMPQIVELLLAVNGGVTIMVEGEMGSGKSSILPALHAKLPDHVPCYVECACMDVGDIAVPKIITLDGAVLGEFVTSGEVCRFVPNESFGLHLGKKLIIMWDELGKAPRAVINAVSRVINEGALGLYRIMEGSIQFATTNLAAEGVGDQLLPHIRDRMCRVKMRKPTHMEWVENYAMFNQLHPAVIGFAMEYPQAFESFEDVEDPNSNHYIFHPKSPRRNFVTARSLTKSSHLLFATERMTDDVRIHALMGMVGEAAAMDIITLARLSDDLPTFERIIMDPSGCQTPKSGVASCMLIAKIAMRIDRENLDACMEYVQRLSKEVQALFARTIMRSAKKDIAASHKSFIMWASDNMYLFS